MNNQSFLKLPTFLFDVPRYSDISAEAKILYANMINRKKLSIKNNWKNEGGIFILFSRLEMCAMLKCGQQKVRNILFELKCVDLLTEKRQGLNRPNVIYVNDNPDDANNLDDDNITLSPDNSAESTVIPCDIPCEDACANNNTLEQTISQQVDCNNTTQSVNNDYKVSNNYKVNKDCVVDANLATKKCNNKNKYSYKSKHKNSATSPIFSGLTKPNTLDQLFSTRNKSYIKNTYNNIDRSEPTFPKLKTTNELEEQLDYKNLLKNNPEHIPQIKQLTSLIAQTLKSTSAFLHIARQSRSTNEVKAKFSKLDAQCIEYILHSYSRVSEPINNLRAYLLAALYNAPDTVGFYKKRSHEALPTLDQSKNKMYPHGFEERTYTNGELDALFE